MLRIGFAEVRVGSNYSSPNPAARMLRIGFVKTIAVVWADPWLTPLKIRPRCPSFPEWPRHVPSEVSTCFFCRAGPRLAL